MKNRKLKIKDFWWFHNDNCWRIKRQSMVDFYLYIPTMRYIYFSKLSGWKGTKDPTPVIMLNEKERNKIKTFESEDEAVRWLSGEKRK